MSVKDNITDPANPVTYITCGCSFENKCKVCNRYTCIECVSGYQISLSLPFKGSICIDC